MTATDELRRMLDERGVDYRSSVTGYSVDLGPYTTVYANRSDTTLDVSLRQVTPEQAIEATLGRGTCSIRGGECDQCGAYIHKDAVLFWVPVDEGMRTVESRDVSYCPNCGRRVVAGDA